MDEYGGGGGGGHQIGQHLSYRLNVQEPRGFDILTSVVIVILFGHTTIANHIRPEPDAQWPALLFSCY